MNARTRTFWIVLLLVPFLLLISGEVLLRLFDYGGNLDLVVKTTVQGKEYYTLNRNFARRYFSQQGIAIPEAHDDIFEIHKPAGTKRIFMLGESTMAGFPFDYNATPPQLLGDLLQQLVPSSHIEVVNAGLSAINSYTVRDIADELAGYDPDAFVIYLGHNEFYGAMGIGSTEYLGKSRVIIDLYLKLNNLRLFRLVRDGVVALRRVFSPDPAPRDASLMEAMVRQKAIAYGSDDYNTARRNFEANLRAIIDIAKRRNIPVVLSTLVSNVRDQPPFLPVLRENISDKTRQECESILAAGRAARDSGDFRRALENFRHAFGLDSGNAEAHYLAAKCLDTLGQFEAAKSEYEKSRDYDGMRFRASSDFNRLLRALSVSEHVSLADPERAFEQQSPHALVGHNLMFEHLHPTFDGYLLLARTFCRTITDDGILGKEFRWDSTLSGDRLRENAGVTDFDLEVGRYRILELTSSWPFKPAGTARETYVPQNSVQTLAASYCHKGISWSQAHYDLAVEYAQRGMYDPARQEYFAVSKVAPYSYYPYMMMGDMYRLMEQPSDAESMYTHALAAQESPYVHVRLGMLYFEANKTPQAIGEFESTIAAESRSGELMDVKARSTVRYFLGASYGRSGSIDKAKVMLRAAVQLDPQNIDAKNMLAQIP